MTTLELLESLQVVTHVDLGWMALAECQGQPDLFFSPSFERPNARLARETAAKEICAQCPSKEHQARRCR